MNPAADFDRDFALGELINKADADDICRSLLAIFGDAFALLDDRGTLFSSAAVADGTPREPLTLELEPVGFLAGGGRPEARQGAARLVRWGLVSRARFRMVSDLHLEAVRSDYAKLQQQNEALKASEAKFRQLSEALDAKVKEQIKVIDERQRQLYQAERLASIGQLAAGVAHEINNPLGFINSNLSAAERYLGSLGALQPIVPAAEWKARDLAFVLEDFAELLRDSQVGIARISRIVKDLKGFSSVDQPEEQVVDLNAQIESLLAVVAGQKPEGVALVSHFAPLPPLLCLPGHLNQAFLNVLQNALQAVNGHGTVTVSSQASAESISIRIADDGPGIPDEVYPKIFDPFFTTRGVGGGTGLGLTVARDIVLAHNGTIDVSSPPGGGTTVTVVLPV